jgi:sugar phosphate permease
MTSDIFEYSNTTDKESMKIPEDHTLRKQQKTIHTQKMLVYYFGYQLNYVIYVNLFLQKNHLSTKYSGKSLLPTNIL